MVTVPESGAVCTTRAQLRSATPWARRSPSTSIGIPCSGSTAARNEDKLRPVPRKVVSGNSWSPAKLRSHGRVVDGEYGNYGHSGLEHRCGCCDRKPERHTDNGCG